MLWCYGVLGVCVHIEKYHIKVGMKTRLLKCRRGLSYIGDYSQRVVHERDVVRAYVAAGFGEVGGSGSPPSPAGPQPHTQDWDTKPTTEVVCDPLTIGSGGDGEENLIECEICYSEVHIERMIQCPDAHLFCFSCVENYVKESVYGGYARARIGCLDSECSFTYQLSQLKRCLSDKLMAKYLERQEEESINVASMDDFVRCPNCNYGAILPLGSKVMECKNPECGLSTCRYCKVDWDEHIGIPCKEIEQKDETKLRLAFEEKMSQAKIRTCNDCKAAMVKSEGCNKMTCRCGTKMCYICRITIKCYSHFCQHVREPGRPCDKCQKCSLWTNAEEDDARAISEIKDEAKRKRKEEGYIEEKEIGAPSPAKRAK